MKTCTKCQTLKNFSEFHKYGKSIDGYKHHCKSCVRQYDQVRIDDFRVMPRKTNGDLVHCRHCEKYLDKSNFSDNDTTYCKECKKYIGASKNLKKKSITVEQWIEMSKAQNDVCMICKKEDPNKRLSVDHDHSCCPGAYSCGKCIRGLLCSYCNKTLGMAKDNVQLLQDMIDYLQK